jgi:cytochrome c oxidase subunit 4
MSARGEGMKRPERHVVGDGTYLKVWAALVGLTGLLVVAGRLFHESLAVPALLTITPLKAGLVLYYFMHLKYERPYIRGMVFTALATLTVFIGFLFFDLSFR